MDGHILSLLEPAELDHILAELARHSFVPGERTAQGGARSAKDNLQLDPQGPAALELGRIVLAALRRNETFQAFALPRRVMPPLFNRYEAGMAYGAHVDGGILATAGEPMRTDLALTVFLSAPESYDGGELILEQPAGEEEVKLEAGEAVIYAATCVHRVNPVRSGVRLAAVTWVQSAVRDEQMRSVLYDLQLALRGLADQEREALLVSKSYQNLLRLAAEL
jgi:PKHD-type hydroxylase